MDYRQATVYLYEIEDRLGSDYSLDEVIHLSECMGRPERKTKIIHIAGTNGKGSVGNYLCRVLALSGYRVGRFASPAVFHDRECIQYIAADGGRVIYRDISEKETAEAVTALRACCEEMVSEGYKQPTAFEIETVMAFVKFADWNVDVAVVECGLGGRLDATNIIEEPQQCIFTSIDIDHQGVLGSSVEQIAREKYGIIKPGTQAVSAISHACADMLQGICRNRNAALYLVDEESINIGECTVSGTHFSYRGKEYRTGQPGIVQAENACLAIEALFRLRESGFDMITDLSVYEGIQNSRWRGRFDVLSACPYVIVDGAHNPSAMVNLKASLEQYFPGETFDFILGVFADKDYQQEMEILAPLMHRAYTVTAPGKRGLSGERLGECILCCAKRLGMDIVVTSGSSIEDACSEALQGLDEGRKLVVCGSLSIVGDAYSCLKKQIGGKKDADRTEKI